jgi:hypothetical protein
MWRRYASAVVVAAPPWNQVPPQLDFQLSRERGVALMSGWTDDELAKVGAADELDFVP